MTTAELLYEARAVIDTEDKWTQGALARNAGGQELVSVLSPGAVCYCAGGAIAVAFGERYPDGSSPVWLALEAVISGVIPTWNDKPERTHAEVLAAFDKAIEVAERG